MPLGYWVSVVLHVLAALSWLGGLFFLALVGAPVLRKVSPPALRQSLFQQLGMRARTVGWIAIAILLVTGTINLWYRGYLVWDGVLGSGAFWQTGFGIALGVKLAAVTGMLVTSAVHDFRVGPAAGRAAAEQTHAMVLRRRASLLARGTALFGLVVVVAAVHLARG